MADSDLAHASGKHNDAITPKTCTTYNRDDDDLWKGAFESKIGGVILQLVGMDSPTKTVFGRILRRLPSSSLGVPASSLGDSSFTGKNQSSSSECDNNHNHNGYSPIMRASVQMQQQTCSYSVQDVLEWMLTEVRQRQATQGLRQQQLSARELLQLGSVWRLSPKPKSNPSLKRKATNQKQQQTRTRLSLEHSHQPWHWQDSLRVHVCASRFPAVYTVNWSISYSNNENDNDNNQTRPEVQNQQEEEDCHHQNNATANNSIVKPRAIFYHNADLGFFIVQKPCGVPSHATVDNGVENVLNQLMQHNGQHNGRILETTPSIPQRLDIETEGLLLVSTKREFSSYIGRLLQQKTNVCLNANDKPRPPLLLQEGTFIEKQYRCLLHIFSTQDYERLCHVKAHGNNHPSNNDGTMVVTHYMDPMSPAPKTFVAVEPPPTSTETTTKEKWLKCVLRVLRVGPLMQFTMDVANDINNTKDVGHEELASLVAEITVELWTGRTHQIRGQLAAMGLPLVGDPLYGPPPQAMAAVTNDNSLVVEKDMEWDKTRCRGASFSPERNDAATKSDSSGNNKLALQCCSLRFRKPKWCHRQDGKHDRPILLEDNDEYFCFVLGKAWWSEQLQICQKANGV